MEQFEIRAKADELVGVMEHLPKERLWRNDSALAKELERLRRQLSPAEYRQLLTTMDAINERHHDEIRRANQNRMWFQPEVEDDLPDIQFVEGDGAQLPEVRVGGRFHHTFQDHVDHTGPKGPDYEYWNILSSQADPQAVSAFSHRKQALIMRWAREPEHYQAAYWEVKARREHGLW